MATPEAAHVLRRTLLAGTAVAALGAGALAAQDAQAAFSLNRCQGASGVVGRGASFQNTLHSRFKTFFETSNGCNGSPTGPTYTSTGSGDGRAAMGAGGGDLSLRAGERLATVSFAAADEAPTPAQVKLMNDGPTANTADDGVVHTIPIATGASAFILHVPEGCSISAVTNKTNAADGAYNGATTGDRADNFTQRVRVTNRLIEAAFGGDSSAATWGQIVPSISGTPTGIPSGDQTNVGVASCANVPVRRIVRQDSSGTTYGWKAYLNLIAPSRRWTGDVYGATNTRWPAAGGSGVGTVVAAATGTDCTGTDRLCSPTARGGGALARLVASTDGSIGYVDLATARSNGFEVTPAASEAAKDYTYWSPLEVMSGSRAGSYAEPTVFATSHVAGGDKGAACATAPISAGPAASADPTLGDWSNAYAAGGDAYPACVVTYALAWDDNAPVYGNTADEEAKARTVKDYLSLIVSDAGQTFLLTSDYSALPTQTQTWARTGVDAINWNKSTTVVDPPRENPPVVNPPVVNPPVVNPPAPAPVSNSFSIPSSKTAPTLLTFTVQLPGAGALKATATTKVGKKNVNAGSATGSVRGAGRVTLRIKLSSAAKKALARAKSKKITVKVAFTYTPTGGTAKTVTKNVTVRAAKKPAKRKAAKR
ncbi:hypothetical protein Q5424_20845 [Conexibacter sp. JD483]|uniref:hypothetical protein n=1 Tax=unclassified Conexibacter TaxID=2627773 RepID=UPI00271C47C1|nr:MULTISPECIES: hypothetical protein [unclassified Conexibacter]MDO8185020.1 hypothetical protein [Conexibacter sp. CPCC 205706]MDO8198164.1 hypothetical protein [Conexibacter sp. CPCC 205762]MDR9371560.1 hypothetical protein [Conexibacter sp. JD483]